MSIRLILSAAAALTLSSPTWAQTTEAPAAPPAAAAEDAMSPEEAAIDAAGDAFGADMEAMQAELSAAKAAAGADTAKANADADAIVAKYQPKADAFATQVEAFMATHGDEVPVEARDQVQQAIASIRTVPNMVRQGVMSAPAAPPAAE